MIVSFSATTDFTELADKCERFAEVLVECNAPRWLKTEDELIPLA